MPVSAQSAIASADAQSGDLFEPSVLLPWTSDSIISAISIIGEQEFYDLTVPGYANYLANGMWHHNSGKSLTFGVYLGLHCWWGLPWFDLEIHPSLIGRGVLIVDYEDTEDEWKLRLHEVASGLGYDEPDRGIRWMPGAGIPLVDQKEAIKRVVAEHNIGLMIVDSCISAVGGDLLDTSSAQRLVNWLTALGRDANVTTVMLAHNAKTASETNTLYPYGNIFWHNLPRATVYIESSQLPGSRQLDMVLHPRKANRGKGLPIPVRVMFPDHDGGPVTFVKLDHVPEVMQSDEKKSRWLVMSTLQSGAMTVSELAQATGLTEDNIHKIIRREPGYFTSVGKKGRANLYGLSSERDEEPY